LTALCSFHVLQRTLSTHTLVRFQRAPEGTNHQNITSYYFVWGILCSLLNFPGTIVVRVCLSQLIYIWSYKKFYGQTEAG